MGGCNTVGTLMGGCNTIQRNMDRKSTVTIVPVSMPVCGPAISWKEVTVCLYLLLYVGERRWGDIMQHPPFITELPLWHRHTAGRKFKPEDMGTKAVDCSDVYSSKTIADMLGYYALPQDSIHMMVNNFLTVGTCTSQVRNHKTSYAQWLRTVRCHSSNNGSGRRVEGTSPMHAVGEVMPTNRVCAIHPLYFPFRHGARRPNPSICPPPLS